MRQCCILPTTPMSHDNGLKAGSRVFLDSTAQWEQSQQTSACCVYHFWDTHTHTHTSSDTSYIPQPLSLSQLNAYPNLYPQVNLKPSFTITLKPGFDPINCSIKMWVPAKMSSLSRNVFILLAEWIFWYTIGSIFISKMIIFGCSHLIQLVEVGRHQTDQLISADLIQDSTGQL